MSLAQQHSEIKNPDQLQEFVGLRHSVRQNWAMRSNTKRNKQQQKTKEWEEYGFQILDFAF